MSNVRDFDSRLVRLVRAHGIVLAHRGRGAKSHAEYDGRTVCIDGCCIENDSNLAHELAHRLLAAPKRRSLPNYGLGIIGGDSTYWARRVVVAKRAQREEEMASALGILIERSLGLDWKGTYQYHCWQSDGSFARVGRRVQKRGLLIGARPTCLSVLDK